MQKKHFKKALAIGLVLANTGLWNAHGYMAPSDKNTYGTVDVNGYDYAGDIAKTATRNSGVMYDGGWYAPDGKFYTYVDENGNLSEELHAYNVVSNKAVGLSEAQEQKLVSMGLDHNEQADSVADNKRVPSYLQIMGGEKFTAENVATALADNLKFNSDLVRTVCQWEEADRKATDKFLDDKINTIGIVQNGNGFIFTDGNNNQTTLSFSDIDTNTTVSGVTTIIDDKGILTTTVASSDNTSVFSTADIGTYVKNNAADAIINNSNTTIEQAINTNTENITNNTTNIENIQKSYVTNITENIEGDYTTWTVTQTGGDGKPITITDKYITGFAANSISVSDDGKFTTTINRNDGTSFSQTVDMSSYVSTYVKNNAGSALINYEGDKTTQTTIENAINNTYTEAKKHTTIIAGNNIVVNEERNEDGGKKYTVATADDVDFRTVSTDTINAQNANIGRVDADKIYANYINAGEVTGTTAGFTTVNAGTVNASTVNTGAVNSNTVSTQMIYLGTSSDYTTVKYDKPNDRITYNNNVIATLGDGMNYGADQGDALSLTLNDTLTINGDKNITTISDGKDRIAVTLNDDISVTTINSTTTNTTTVNTKTVNIGDTITIEENNINIGDNKITNVHEGDVYQGSTDVVNGGQLWQTNQNITNLDHRVSSLGHRMNKVGAGAAALAALHPLDFDPDDKLSFAAGVGNYAGATASAIGAFYRPDERVMFSIGGTIGNGENMVNAGISFALGKGGKINNSRVAMTHEINDLRQQVAYLSAVVAQMAAQTGYQFTDMKPFPDTPENHWAYEYVARLAAKGIVEGYPSGNFDGERTMTRYEFAAMLFRALEKGFRLDTEIIDEFEPELGRLSVERIKGEQNQKDKIERVRINDQGTDRDNYGGKINVGKVW